MKFLADMCVPLRMVEWLRQRNHDVVHLRELKLSKISDAEIFSIAERESRVVLTLDLDFGEIVASSGKKIPSVITFRLHNTRTTHAIERLKRVLEVSSEAIEKGAIVTVEETRHRIRSLPLFQEETEKG